jgi:hypothetical protein
MLTPSSQVSLFKDVETLRDYPRGYGFRTQGSKLGHLAKMVDVISRTPYPYNREVDITGLTSSAYKRVSPTEIVVNGPLDLGIIIRRYLEAL